MKPLPSTTTRDYEVLPCQQILPFEYNKTTGKKNPLPDDLRPIPDPYHEDDGSSELLAVVRNTNLQASKDFQSKMPTWSGSHALVSKRQAPIKKVGFAPIIPSPITKYETVFTVLKNLSSFAEKLSQKVLPFVTDEGVYHIIIDLYCHDSQLFKNLLPMLGTFHMAKNAMRCCGKFLRGSGIESCLIETVIFGSKILEQVLTGSHYYRSFAGLCIIEDAVMQLKMEAFLDRNTNPLSPAGREVITMIRNSLVDMNTKKAKAVLASVEVQNALKK